MRIACITSRFPKLTETFILYEVLGLERAGVRVDFYPLLREQAEIVHEEAAAVVERAHFLPFISWPIMRSQVELLRAEPGRYLGTLASVLRGTWRSRNFLIGAIGIFPKVVHAARLMKRDGVEHVHCHFATHATLAGFMIRRLVDIPYSFTAQGSDLHVDRTMLCAKMAEASFVVAISEFNKGVILAECGDGAASKLRVLHSGVDTDYFVPTERRADGGRFTILCVGTLHEVKGQRYLVDACRVLADADIDFACNLVGEGPDHALLAAAIEQAGLDDRVALLGALPRSDVAELLRSADVLVAPSVPTADGKKEGIPVVLMEALASAVPVVATRISGIPELVEHGHTGLLVGPRDAVALGGALQLLAADPALRRRLGGAGREKVVQEFDAYANAARLAREIAASLGRPRESVVGSARAPT